jgi:hypothetical protein
VVKNCVEGLQSLDVVVGTQELGFALDERPRSWNGRHWVLTRPEPSVGVQPMRDGTPRPLQHVKVDRAPERDIAIALEPAPTSGRIVEEVS